MCFLPPLKKERGREWKFFLQVYGHNVLRHPEGRLRIPPGWLGMLPARKDLKETWEKDENGRYAHFFFGVHPGRMAANFVSYDPEEIRTAISLPFHRNTLLEQLCLFASAGDPVPARQCEVIADILLDGMRITGEGSSSRLIRETLQLILDQPCHPELSVKWISQKLHCHPDYLSRRFHQETGHPLMKYVREKRMEIAADLLRSRKRSVAEVAAGCGYRDHSYFTRVFHQTYGVVPSQWTAE